MHHDRPAGRTGIAGLPQWPTAIARLGALYEAHGAEAEARAHRYADRYRGRRAAMVFDVVASRQRRYETRVLPMVDRFAQTEAARSLEALVRLGVGAEFRLRQGEVETMRGVAEGLLRFGRDHGLEDDERSRGAGRRAVASSSMRRRSSPTSGLSAGSGLHFSPTCACGPGPTRSSPTCGCGTASTGSASPCRTTCMRSSRSRRPRLGSWASRGSSWTSCCGGRRRDGELSPRLEPAATPPRRVGAL